MISFASRLSISLALGLNAYAQTCVAPPPGLSAWISFDEPLFRNQPNRIDGRVGKAMHFDGVSQFFEMPPNAGFNVGESDFSVEMWMRTSDKKATRNIVDYRNEEPRGWLLYIRRETLGFQAADGAQISNVIASNYPIADGRWHHVVAVAKRLPPQPPALYVDGVLRMRDGRATPLSNLDHKTPLWLARHHRNSIVGRDNVYFGGDIDEVSVYRRALAESEVASLFRAGRAGKCRK